MPRQEILEASAARPRLSVSAVSEAELAEALAAAAARRGFDLAREPPLRAHLFAAGRADEHVLLLLLHHIAGDGWSLAPLARDLSRFYEARRRGRGGRSAGACRCNMPTTRCGSGACWGRRAMAASAIGRQLRSGPDGSRAARADRSAERPAAACGVELSRGSVGFELICAAARGACWSLRGRAGRACSWCCRPGLRRC